MKIFNIMLSKDLGGIQQAFLDYNILLKMGGYEPISIVAKDAQVASSLQKDGQTFNTLSNISHFDIFAIWKLRKMILKESPKALILHGNRAINLAYWASFLMKNRPILISVAHNYSYRHLKKCDYIFSITQSMTDHLIKNGVNRSSILNMPNFIDTDAYNFAPKAPFKHISKSDKTKPLRIGTLARFVHKKGVDILIKSISILKKQGYNVTLLIGGEGSEKDALNRLITELDLTAEVKFLGWVRDKESFFEQIDKKLALLGGF